MRTELEFGHKMQRHVAVFVSLGSLRHTNEAVIFITAGNTMDYFGLERLNDTVLHISGLY